MRRPGHTPAPEGTVARGRIGRLSDSFPAVPTCTSRRRRARAARSAVSRYLMAGGHPIAASVADRAPNAIPPGKARRNLDANAIGRAVTSPLIADTGSSASSEQVRATPNIPLDERGDAISIVEVDVENALSPHLALVARDHRREREEAAADNATGDLDIVIRQARQGGRDVGRAPVE